MGKAFFDLLVLAVFLLLVLFAISRIDYTNQSDSTQQFMNSEIEPEFGEEDLSEDYQ